MNDAIVLLSISQIVCLGGLAYLYLQLQSVERGRGRRRRRPAEAMRGQPLAAAVHMPGREPVPAIITRTAKAATVANAPEPASAPVPVARRMAELGVDIATMARRMNRSEEEVRLMLRRQAARS